MKSGKPNEPKNKARLRMEAFKAARGIPIKGKSLVPKVTTPKMEVLPALIPKVSKEENLSTSTGAVPKKEDLVTQKPTVSKEEVLSKPKGGVPEKKDLPAPKTTVHKKKMVSKPKGTAPVNQNVSKAKSTAMIKSERAQKSRKSS